MLFIDEIDSITPKRETASKEMERRIVSQLIACLDGKASFENNSSQYSDHMKNRKMCSCQYFIAEEKK